MAGQDIRLSISKALEGYADSVSLEIQEAVKSVAKDTVSQLKSASPKKTGTYAKSWKQKTEITRHGVKAEIYNTKAGLTHLLEHGHVIRNGTGRTYGRVNPKVHIKPIADQLDKNLENEIARRLK